MEKAADKKEKVFKAGFTLKTLVAVIIPLVVSGTLFILGRNYAALFPGPGNEAWKIIFGYVPMAFGILVLLIALWTIIDNLMIKITITPTHLECKKGKKEMSVKWRILAFAPPQSPKKYVRMFAIGDGKVLFHITDVFFPKFDQAIKIIDKAKKSASRAEYEI